MMVPFLRDMQAKLAVIKEKHSYFIVVLAAYLLFAVPIFFIINAIQPEPFIDETFHIPQGLKYIQGNFTEWDPKITTLPGLYVVTTIIYNSLSIFTYSALESLRIPLFLRILNVLISIFSLYGVYQILIFNDFSGRKVISTKKASWVTWNIAIFPISFFFNFLYYTDTLSTYFVIMMFKSHLEKNFKKAAALGFCAVITRQTNIVWLGYCLLDLLLNRSELKLRRRQISEDYLMNITLVFRNNDPRRLLKNFFNKGYSYLLVCSLFILFIFYNDGIVVGDRNAHRPVLHLCQLFYFCFFVLMFGFPLLLSHLKEFPKFIKFNKKIMFILTLICLITVYYNTMAHRYLLSDNRHFTFYLWQRVYARNKFVKFILIPVYIFTFYAITKTINVNNRLQYWLCTCLCLVPQQLLEFRYFIIPYILYRLEVNNKPTWILLIESLLFIFINFVTLYIFVSKTFTWPDSDVLHRIIW